MHASCKAFNVFPPDNVTFSFRSGSGSFLDVNYALESQLNSSNETYDVTAKLIIMANEKISFPEKKQRASEALNSMKLTVSDAIRLLMLRIVDEHRLPFEIKVPSQSSRIALAEIAAGKTKNFDSIDDLMADLHSED